jgi:hypothetical protein
LNVKSMMMVFQFVRNVKNEICQTYDTKGME